MLSANKTSEKLEVVKCLETKCKKDHSNFLKVQEAYKKKFAIIKKNLDEKKITYKEFWSKIKKEIKKVEKANKNKIYVKCQLKKCLEETRKMICKEIKNALKFIGPDHVWYKKYKFFEKIFVKKITQDDVIKFQKFLLARKKLL